MFFLAASEAEYGKSPRIIRFADTSGTPFSLMPMFRILVLQSLHDFSDGQMEFQIPDGLSFMCFLGLSMEDTVPDAETIWHYRETFTCIFRGCHIKIRFARTRSHTSKCIGTMMIKLLTYKNPAL